MSDDLKTIEEMFGKNYKQKILKAYMNEFIDEETQVLFEELCAEINDSDILNNEIIEIIKVLPYNMSYSLIYSIKNRSPEELMGLLHLSYYEEFIKAVNNQNSEGLNEFEMRFINLKTNTARKDAKRFLNVRLLTREELQVLISFVQKKGDVNLGLGKQDYEFYKGNNKYCKQLIKAHSVLTSVGHSNARTKIIEINKKQYLLNILREIKKQNKTIEQ